MKKTGICPKCTGNRLLQLTGVAEEGPIGTERWQIARCVNPDKGIFAAAFVTKGFVEAFVCRSCGFTELYTIDPENILVDGTAVRELVGPPPEGPYR